MSRCSCPPSGIGDPDCPTHGLKDGQAFPPMDRHALPGEDAKMAQRRLYRASLGLPRDYECLICGRVGVRGFERMEFRRFGFRCRHRRACERRIRDRPLSEEQRTLRALATRGA